MMQSLKQLGLLSSLACAVSLWTSPVLAQAAAGKPNVVMIFDSSRSMWGQIDGINKVVIARTVLGQIAEQFAAKTKLGLVAYGHRQSAGCSDIEALLPLGAYKAKDFTGVVNSIRPKGSTPIADALVQAAKTAGYSQHKATLVLVADGLDNCKGDPCATAAKLKRTAPDLTIHVIAFDRKTKQKLKALSCIAERSGGTFVSATSEEELLSGLEKVMSAVSRDETKTAEVALRTSQELAALDGKSPMQEVDPTITGTIPVIPPVAPTAGSDMVAEAPKSPEKASTLDDAPVPISLRALLTEAGPEIKVGLVWRIFDAKPDGQGRYVLVSTHREASPTAALVVGNYLVNAAYGLSHVTKKMTVIAGVPVSETLVLNAGGLRLGSVLANGSPIAPNSVRYDIFADETDQFGNRDKILGDAKPGLVVRLNAGAYHIVSVYGDANAVVRADVAVEPGKLTEATINHSAARVTFKLVLQPGGEALPDTQWNILTPGGDVVKESAGALPSHILAIGSYTVLARYKEKNYSREFKLEAGEDRQIEVVIR